MSVLLLRDLFTFVTVTSLVLIGALITLRSGRTPVDAAGRSTILANVSSLALGLATCLAVLLAVQGFIGFRMGSLP